MDNSSDQPITASDRSCEIGTRLATVKAIADLVYMVAGDGVEEAGRLDELHAETLHAAMFCIQQNIEEVEAFQDEHNRYMVSRWQYTTGMSDGHG